MKRLLIILSFFLSSCGLLIKGPIYKPIQKNSTVLSDTINNNYFTYSDGTTNFFKKLIVAKSDVIVLCIPGLGAHTGSYNFIQNYLYKNGVSSISIDLRGFGHWRGEKGDIKNIGLHIRDLNEVINYLNLSYPRKKIILLGESLGSSLCLWYAKLYPNNISGLILTSLVTKNGGGKTNSKTIINLLFSYAFCPHHPVYLGYDPYIYSNDSSFIHWAFNQDTLGTNSISPRYLVQAKRVIKNSYKYICQINKPILILQGGKDFLSKKEDIISILKNCDNSNNIKYVYYPLMLHSLVNDRDRIEVFNDIRKWINVNYGCQQKI